jgi:hypothetical protein
MSNLGEVAANNASNINEGTNSWPWVTSVVQNYLKLANTNVPIGTIDDGVDYL